MINSKKICNICSNTEFVPFNGREKALCSNCNSLERTRAIHYLITKNELVKPGYKVLHFAPEPAIGFSLLEIVGRENYECYDISPERYHPRLEVKHFDLTEAEKLPLNTYDFILHSHVLEHVPCFITPVLWHLQNSLTERGHQLFCIPIPTPKYSADFSDMSKEKREKIFGQHDHVRNFGLSDISMTIGKVFKLSNENYGIRIPYEDCEKHNMSSGEISKTMFLFKKSDILLR